jgi:hypothetical protein
MGEPAGVLCGPIAGGSWEPFRDGGGVFAVGLWLGTAVGGQIVQGGP